MRTIEEATNSGVWIISTLEPTEFVDALNVGCDYFKIASRILSQVMRVPGAQYMLNKRCI